MRIIFQDIDGPLIPLRMYFGGNRPYDNNARSFVYDPIAVAMVNSLCQKFWAKMVWNTAHNENPPEVMRHQAQVNGLTHLHDDCQTDYQILVKNGRKAAIDEWLSRHPEVIDWIVIDDILVHEPRQVWINYEIGMTLKDYQDARRLFGDDPERIIGVGQAIGMNKT